MYSFEVTTIVQADPAALWQAWTDMPRFPQWDPREEETRLDGPFAAGTSGWSKQRGNPGGPFTIARIVEGRRWDVTSPLPGGKLDITHEISPLPDGKVQLRKQYDVHGPLTVLFRLHYARKVRKAMPDSFAALVGEATRLAAGSSS